MDAPTPTAESAHPPIPNMNSTKRLGFYLHTSWEFKYPFAVRSWQREDFSKWGKLMRALDMDLLMMWPLFEVIPAPISEADKAAILGWKQIVEDAKAQGLEVWITQCPNCTTRPEITERPYKERHFYPYRIDVHLDDLAASEAYFAHRRNLMSLLDNADGYVTIDGDPGGYPGAQPAKFLEVFQHDRALLDSLERPEAQLIPWLWSGWGGRWEAEGAWQEPLEPLTEPVLELLKTEMPEPYTLMPGRSVREGWANGRKNFALAEQAGVVEQSMLLCYEIVEFEPTQPAIILQFDDIRRVLREEAELLKVARGIMGNAQQPVVVLPNIYLFARGARDPKYLDRSDKEVLADFAEFLGGDAEILIPAWQSGYLPLEGIPADLAARLREASLTSEAAAYLPGGPQNYLQILASWVEARRQILVACTVEPGTATKAASDLCSALQGMVRWWQVHGYVCTGAKGDGFDLEWTHPLLLDPVQEWCKRLSGDRAELQKKASEAFTAIGLISRAETEAAFRALLS